MLRRIKNRWLGIMTRLGVRGQMMLLLGLAWMLLGMGVETGAYQPINDPDLVLLWIPAQLRAVAWMLTGAFAVYGAWFQSGKSSDWPNAALVIMPMLRCVSYAWAWLLYVVPDACLRFLGMNPDIHVGLQSGWYWAVTYGLLLIAVNFTTHIPAGPAVKLAAIPPELDASRG